jgi:hypothetical protein
VLEVCAGPDLVPPRASGMTDELVEYPKRDTTRIALRLAGSVAMMIIAREIGFSRRLANVETTAKTA